MPIIIIVNGFCLTVTFSRSHKPYLKTAVGLHVFSSPSEDSQGYILQPLGETVKQVKIKNTRVFFSLTS